MKIHSLNLNIQDVKTADDKDIAAVMGTLYIDNGEVYHHNDGTPMKDDNGETTPEYEKINFVTSLGKTHQLKSVVQALITEAITLKNYKIAKKEGQLSHFLEAMGDTEGAKQEKKKEKKLNGPRKGS